MSMMDGNARRQGAGHAVTVLIAWPQRWVMSVSVEPARGWPCDGAGRRRRLSLGAGMPAPVSIDDLLALVRRSR